MPLLRFASWAIGSFRTMRFGRTAKVLAECKLKYYRISECSGMLAPVPQTATCALL